jgi:dTDP-4-dehydrorhamnose 3,5-epimerase-like enzyme
VADDLLRGCRLLSFSVRGDERGSLVAIEGFRECPFPIARVYYVYGTSPGVDRGLHAHRALNQLAVAVAGSCTMMLDDGKKKLRVRLENPATGLTIGPMIWHEMSEFSDDCVLLVLADSGYDEADYIRNYDEFLAAARS